jgi:hypothetical protein
MSKFVRLISLLILVVVLGRTSPSIAQEKASEPTFHNYVSAFTGYTYVFNVEDKIEHVVFGSLLVPIIGVTYGRRFIPKLGLSFSTEMALGSFAVIKDNQETIVRDRAVIFSLQAIYEFAPRWVLFSGYGYEMEKNENLNVFRAGVEYELPIQKNWDVGFALIYDYKNIYHTITFSIAFGKHFGKQFSEE